MAQRRSPTKTVSRARSDTALLREILQRLTVVETQNGTIIEEQARAREHRSESYTRSGELVVQMAGTVARVDRMEPVVKTLEDDRQRLIGARIFGTLAAKAAHAGSVAVGGVLVWVVDHFFSGGAPR